VSPAVPAAESGARPALRRRAGTPGAAYRPRRFLVLSLLPALVLYSVFMFVPLLYALQLSLYQGEGFVLDRFVGLQNFVNLFTASPYRERFVNAFGNNFLFFGVMMLAQNVGGLFLAVLLTSRVRLTRLFRTVFFLPLTLSPLIVGVLWMLILNPTWGILPKALRLAGLGAWAQPWLGLPETALPAIALINSWQWVGLAMMFFIAGIEAIPAEIFDAAKVDGAAGWRLFGRVTFPLLLPIFGMVSVLTFIGNFTAFDIVYAMATSEAHPNYATDIFGTFFYRTAFGRVMGGAQDVGMASAIATVMFAIIFTVTAAWQLVRRGQARDFT
jgi:raffinose/stachyose/melibiose transport system permease protein